MLDLNPNRERFALNNLEIPVSTESPRDAVKEWLKIQPRLTTQQIALLDNKPRRGGQTDPYFPKKNSKKAYPAFQIRTARLLRAMELDGEIHSDRDHNNQPRVWMMPGVSYPQNFYGRSHELDVADLFVRYYPHVTHWDTEWGELEREKLSIPKYRATTTPGWSWAVASTCGRWTAEPKGGPSSWRRRLTSIASPSSPSGLRLSGRVHSPEVPEAVP